MEEIIIEIRNTAVFQLFGEQPFLIFGTLHMMHGKFCGKPELPARMPLYQRLPEGRLTPVSMIGICSVKIRESACKKQVHQLIDRILINRLLICGIRQRQPQTAKTEFRYTVRSLCHSSLI